MCFLSSPGPTSTMLLVLADLQTPHDTIICYNGPGCTGRKEGLD